MQKQHNATPRKTAGPSSVPKEPVSVVGVPSFVLRDGRIVVEDSQSTSLRSWTCLKVLGQGSFGSVTLCDYKTEFPFPLSPMQRGKTRPEWADKKLVAIKKVRKQFSGWDECAQMLELRSLRALPHHPNIIRLHDYFLSEHNELHFVMEAMEGNLLQLLDSRKGRFLATGLVASIFYQVLSGLNCVHYYKWAHRDMKPDNLLITTTGLHDYQPMSPQGRAKTDVIVIVKIADFGLACEMDGKPHTPYVSTRWYRAPEIVLHGREYSNKVDMWALGAIMAEVVLLRPLFPGNGELDQMSRICDVLGEPTDSHGVNGRGQQVGGGEWAEGVEMAKRIGCLFPQIPPQDFDSFFDPGTPTTLIDCIRDLLRYDPARRLSSRQCLEHHFFTETARAARVPLGQPSSSLSRKPPSNSKSEGSSHHPEPKLEDAPPIPLSIVVPGAGPILTIVVPPRENSRTPPANRMDVSPPMTPRQRKVSVAPLPSVHSDADLAAKAQKLKKPSRWGLAGMFGGEKSQSLDPVATSSRPLSSGLETAADRAEKKKGQKEAARLQDEAEKQRRALMAKNLREQSRAVIHNRNHISLAHSREEVEWQGKGQRFLDVDNPKGPRFYETDKEIADAAKMATRPKEREVSQPPRRTEQSPVAGPSTVHPPAVRQPNRYINPSTNSPVNQAPAAPVHADFRNEDSSQRSHKARRRDHDDDHSMSSFDTYGADRMSLMSQDTLESSSSDPTGQRMRRRRNPMESTSSLATSIDYAASARTSMALSVTDQHHLAREFSKRASLTSPSPSPQPVYSGLPSTQWNPSPKKRLLSPATPPGDSLHINPIFRVPPPNESVFKTQPFSESDRKHPWLPPFSELAAVADSGLNVSPSSLITFSVLNDL